MQETLNRKLLQLSDMEKAFDIVDHSLVLTKLQKNIPNILVNSWLAVYLTGRNQRVKVTGNCNWVSVEAGVIQGSVFGPIQFILLLHDVNNYIRNIIRHFPLQLFKIEFNYYLFLFILCNLLYRHQ